MSQYDGKAGAFSAGSLPPARTSREPVTWGKVFACALAAIFFGELLVVGAIMPVILPHPLSFWYDLAVTAFLLSILVASVLLPVLTRFEQGVWEEDRQALEEIQLRAEERQLFLQLQDALDELAIVTETDADGFISRANDRFCKISQYSRKEILGNPHKMVQSDVHPKEFWKDFWHTICSKKIWRGEICNRAKDGSHYWVDAVVTPVSDASGTIIKFISIQMECTSRKQSEESTVRRLRLLEAVQKITLPAAQPEEWISRALEAGRQALAFDRVILAKRDGDRLVPEFASPKIEGPAAPQPLAESYGALPLAAKDVVPIAKMSASPQAAHPCFLRQNFEAFLGAPVLMKDGVYGALEFLSTPARSRPFDEAEIAFVRILARLLGEALARRNQPAPIPPPALEAAPSAGAVHEYAEPLAAAAAAAAAPAPTPQRPRARQAPEPHLPGVHVLIVDGSPVTRSQLSAMTARWGMIPREVSGGREALGLEETGAEIDMVLLDLQMSDMDGYTLAGELRARRPDLEIIILAPPGDQDYSHLKNLRITRFLTKPVTAEQLSAAILSSSLE